MYFFRDRSVYIPRQPQVIQTFVYFLWNEIAMYEAYISAGLGGKVTDFTSNKQNETHERSLCISVFANYSARVVHTRYVYSQFLSYHCVY